MLGSLQPPRPVQLGISWRLYLAFSWSPRTCRGRWRDQSECGKAAAGVRLCCSVFKHCVVRGEPSCDALFCQWKVSNRSHWLLHASALKAGCVLAQDHVKLAGKCNMRQCHGVHTFFFPPPANSTLG